MAQVVSRQPLTAEARFQFQASPHGIISDRVTGVGYSWGTSVFARQYHFTSAPHSFIYHRSCTVVEIDGVVNAVEMITMQGMSNSVITS